MSEWGLVRIGDLGRIVTGKTPSTSVGANFGGPYPFVTIPDLDGRPLVDGTLRTLSELGAEAVKSSLLPAGSVMMSCIATVGRCGITTRPSFTNQQINTVIPSDVIDARYLYYVLRGLGRELEVVGSGGSVYTNVSKSRFADLRVRIPTDRRVQSEIASVLGSLDDRIDLNRLLVEGLEAIGRAQFRHALGDGEQQDWRLLGSILAELETGNRPRGGVAGYTEGVPSIGAESITGLGQFDFSKTKFIPADFYAALRGGKVRPGDVLLYKDGGRPGMFEPHVTMVGDGFPFAEAAINEHVYRLRAAKPYTQNFLYFWLSSSTASDEMRMKGTGVAVPGLNSEAVRSLRVPDLGPATLEAFDAAVEPVVARALLAARESRTLALTRDTLLSRLLTGELEVSVSRDIQGRTS